MDSQATIDYQSRRDPMLAAGDETSHMVQFYDQDAVLVEAVARFVGAGLAAGESAVLVTTAEHGRAIREILARDHTDLVQAQREDTLHFLDARETLQKFMRDGMPDAVLFRQHVGGLIVGLTGRGRHVRAFGEMVALLVQDDKSAAALRLEDLWNELAGDIPFSLLCAYPLSCFNDARQSDLFRQFCDRHTHVIPCGSDTPHMPAEDTRQLALLQQRSSALDGEIARRKSAESARALLAAIVDCSDDAIISKSLEGVVTSWNAAATRIFGYTAPEMIGQHISKLSPDRLAEEDEIIARLRQGQRVDHFETVRLTKGGALVEVSLSISPVRDSSGTLIGASKIARDITEKKRQQRILDRRNARLRLLNQAAEHLLSAEEPAEIVRGLYQNLRGHLGIDCCFNYIFDETTNTLRLLVCQGVPDNQRIGRLEIPHAAAGASAYERRSLVAHEIRNSTAPATQFLRDLGITAFVSNPLMIGNRLLGTLAFGSRIRDAFQGDELEFILTLCHYVSVALERVRLVDQLRQADRRKDEFIATLAHELRNPLAPIQNCLELLRQRPEDLASGGQLRELMERQVRQLSRLVDELLEVSRITSGKISLRRDTVDLAAIVQNAIDASGPLIEKARHKLSVSFPAETIFVDADSVRLAQVFINLLNNAAKYTDPGGSIEVSIRREHREAVVAIRDSGVGIPAELLPRVFDMFAQVDRTLNRAQGGLGIGLALARSLVELHGGRIEARSAGAGEGSEFIVRMVCLEKQAAVTFEARHELTGAALRQHRILIVDDNRDAANALSMLLQTYSQSTRVAFDGPQALEMAESFRPDVILLDIGMPGMDGFELAARLRQLPWTTQTRLVALSGWGQEEDRRKSRAAGLDHHFTKPVDITALIEYLGQI